MAKLILNDITSGYTSATAFNTNNTLIETALENTLSRDGTGPNTMGANLDLNSHAILNCTGIDLNGVSLIPTGTVSVPASNMIYTPPGTGAVNTTVQNKLTEFISVKDFGAVGDGITNDTAAIQAAILAHPKIMFPNGTYLMNSGVTKAASDVEVNFGNAKFINGGASFLFTFGTRSDTPIYTGLKIYGGRFEQSNPATTSNLNYIRVAGTKDFSIYDCYLKNSNNGGIYIEAGCEDGIIQNVTIDGKGAYAAAMRGIWLAGDTASDFTDQLIDTTSITRNATAVPVYAVKNVAIRNCTVIFPEYGIYFMNTRDCSIENCYIDISGAGATRCIALNSYSPGAKVRGNTLISDRSSTGILITQFSENVLVSDNLFKGTFGGNRDIYVQYLASASISNNVFTTTTTQNIQVDMGGVAFIRGNEFNRGVRVEGTRAVWVVPIDPSQAGTGTIGDTATNVGGVIFVGNTVRFRPLAVLVETNAYPSTSGNKPAIGFAVVRDNLFLEMQVASTVNDYPFIINAGTSANVTPISYLGNQVIPYTAQQFNTPVLSGSAIYGDNYQALIARFRVTVAVSGGAITITKQAGANCSLSASRSGDDLVLVPRSAAGSGAPASVPITGFCDAGGTIYSISIIKSGSNYVFSAYDTAGTKLTLSTVAASFDVTLGPVIAS